MSGYEKLEARFDLRTGEGRLAALEAVGRGGCGTAVAAYLAHKGVKGRTYDAASCPIARFLSGATDEDTWQVWGVNHLREAFAVTTRSADEQMATGDSVTGRRLTPPLQYFALDFDRGAYPELEEDGA